MEMSPIEKLLHYVQDCPSCRPVGRSTVLLKSSCYKTQVSGATTKVYPKFPDLPPGAGIAKSTVLCS